MLALAVPMQAPLAQVRLPALGESATEDFTPGMERRLGDQIMASIRRDPDYLDDPVLLESLQALWLPLVAAARQRGDITPDTDLLFAWEAFLVRDRTVNAFALPGGFIGVHLGLIAITATRDELASVLAHELSHVTQRHIARGTVNSTRSSMIGLAALILGVLAASRTRNTDMANAAIMSGQAASVQGQLNFSRDMEREADRIGFGVLTSAGYAAGGMAAMFEKLDSANRINDNSSFPYLRSHPLTVDRISEARSRVLLPGGAAPAPPLRHALMQARARVLMDTTALSLQRIQDQLAGTAGSTAPLKDRLGALYGGALAASQLGDHVKAREAAIQAQRLLAGADPREPQAERQIGLLQAELALQRGDARTAIQTLDALAVDAGTRAPMLLRAQAALDLQRQEASRNGPELRASVESLQAWVAENKRDAPAWSLLAATAEASGMPLRALRAEAEARAAVGDIGGAIDRLRAGQIAAKGGAGHDFIEASVIDLRLRELQAQRRQMVLEARGGRSTGDESQPPPQ